MTLNGLWNEHWTAAILNHLWQSTLVIVVAWLLTLMLRRYQARTRYWVWMAASLKLLIPFSLLAALGDWLRPASISAVEVPQFPSAMVKAAQPFLVSTEGTVPVTALHSTAVSSSSAHHAGAAEMVVVVWLCGVLFLLFRWSREWWSIRAMLRAASPVSLPMDVPVFLTAHMIEPGIVGIARPVLLLPKQLLERLSPAELRSILTHESCHVQRRDNLSAAIHMVVEAIFWFHPAVWWIERRLIEERERACDEAVLQLGSEAEVYAESLLNVCKFYTESPIACVSGVTGAELKQRIVRIMTKQIALKLDMGRKVLLSAVVIAAVTIPVVLGVLHITEVRAQSTPANPASGIAATWQGTMHANRDLRMVVKIAKADDGTLRATFYNIDRPPGSIPAISAALDGSVLKLVLPFATYEGALSADGNTIKGMWRQGREPLPLSFARATNETAWTIPQPPPSLPPMAADANPAFEVATIKPSGPDEHGPRYNFQGRHFSVVHVSLSDLLKFSYGLQQSQIAKTEKWVSSESYDISAEPDGQGQPTLNQWRSMVKKLMADRFHLKFHSEKQEQTVYALTVAKAGPKLSKSQGDAGGPPGLGFGPAGNFGATNATMPEIAMALGMGVLNKPVVDQTGLTGRFNLRLTWTPDGAAPAESPSTAPDFFTAIQEQLGLKVVSTKASVDVLVIDHVERPTAN